MSDATHLVSKEKRATPSTHGAETLFTKISALELSLVACEALKKPEVGTALIDSLSVLEFTKHTVGGSKYQRLAFAQSPRSRLSAPPQIF